MHLVRPVAICLVLTATQTFAACVPDTGTVLSCSAKGATKAFDVCIDGTNIAYRYGPIGGPPELALNDHVRTVENQPWPGIGRTIWENTTFRNGSYAYEVYIAFDKVDQINDGGVTVYLDGAEVAQVGCDSGSAEIGIWAVSDAKQALGVCWDLDARSWGGC